MGLLEKAQQRKQQIEEAENLDESTIVEETRPSGLLEKARQRKQKITTGDIQKKNESEGFKGTRETNLLRAKS